MSLEPGSTFGRFEVLEQIGSGGMGAVYRARDPRLGRQVALKVLHAQDEQARADVLHEARAAARIDHPNAVQVFDADEVDGVPYIAMELIQGTSLRAMIGREGISIETKVAWLLGIARALAAAHAKGIVHRDLKPENVMIREDGIVKVLDFGIAARMPEVDRSAETGTLEEGGPGGTPGVWAGGTSVKGTVAYCAPEQLRGERIDGRADQFSWGVIACEVFTRARPFDANDEVGLIARVLTEPFDPVRLSDAGVSSEVASTIARALEKRCGDRFASFFDIVAEVESLEHTPTREPNWRPRRPYFSSMLVTSVVATLALCGTAIQSSRSVPRPCVAAGNALVRREEASANAVALDHYRAAVDASRSGSD